VFSCRDAQIGFVYAPATELMSGWADVASFVMSSRRDAGRNSLRLLRADSAMSLLSCSTLVDACVDRGPEAGLGGLDGAYSLRICRMRVVSYVAESGCGLAWWGPEEAFSCCGTCSYPLVGGGRASSFVTGTGPIGVCRYRHGVDLCRRVRKMICSHPRCNCSPRRRMLFGAD